MNDKNNPVMPDEMRQVRLSDSDMERIARRAADIVEVNFTISVGKVAIRTVLWCCGAAVLVFLAWLGVTGKVDVLK